LSGEIAEQLRDWLPYVVQSIEPYTSSEDIAKGARWGVELARELQDSHYGIICVTPDNINSPWLNFEAGALSRAIEQDYVSPFLYRIDRTAVTGPLVQFQSTLFEKPDVFRLIKGINSVSPSPLGEARLERAFDRFWGELRQAIDQVGAKHRASAEVASPTRSTADMMAEVLDLLRAQQKTIAKSPALLTTAESLEKAITSVDIIDTTVLLARLRASADLITGPTLAEGLDLIQVRALIMMLADKLAPLINETLYRGTLHSTEESLRAKREKHDW
jgi:hypothetical protein